MPQINGHLTIMINPDISNIRIQDEGSGLVIADIHITAQNFISAMGRLANVPCSIRTPDPEIIKQRLGKKEEVDSFSFPFKESSYASRKAEAYEEAKKRCPEGWTVDSGFDSQGSFFFHNGENYAKATIRRWIDK